MAGAVPQERQHYWDGIRAFLMLLGIPYHTALCYRVGQDWIVHSGEGAPFFAYLAELIHLFRMPAFFLIAGYFAALMLARKSPAEWLGTRFMRLGVPFLACLATLVPLLNLACELSNLPVPEALASWRHNAATSAGYWIRHLWFIIVLLYCSSAAALVVWRWPALRGAMLAPHLDTLAARHLPALLAVSAILLGIWEAVAIELFYKAGLATNVPQELLRLDELLEFAPFFLLGCLVARAPRTLEQLGRFSWPIALGAVASIGISLVFLDNIAPPLGRFVATIAAITSTQTIIAAARHVVDRPRPPVQRLVAASFVIYLFHMPVIVVLVNLGQHVALPVVAKASAIMLLSLLLSYGAWHIVARSPWLALLFNGAPVQRPARLGIA